jgi:hypothetical protein
LTISGDTRIANSQQPTVFNFNLNYNLCEEDFATEAIMKIKQLRSFIGMVNYYRDMWPQRSHLLASLSCLTSSTANIGNIPHVQLSLDLYLLGLSIRDKEYCLEAN